MGVRATLLLLVLAMGCAKQHTDGSTRDAGSDASAADGAADGSADGAADGATDGGVPCGDETCSPGAWCKVFEPGVPPPDGGTNFVYQGCVPAMDGCTTIESCTDCYGESSPVCDGPACIVYPDEGRIVCLGV